MNKDILLEDDKKELKLSQSEVYFEWWLEELKSYGIVLNYERSKTFELFTPLNFDFFQHYKSKDPLVKQVNALRNVSYTPDYTVEFSSALVGKLFACVNGRLIQDYGREKAPGNIWQEVLFLTTEPKNDKGYTLYFDVKPPAIAAKFSGALGSGREFAVKQRLMYEVHGLFVNRVIPYGQKESLFKKTFMPKRYKWTDGSTKLRTLKDYEKNLRTLPQYLEIKNVNL